MAKRPRFSRWRRLPGAYRSGDHAWPNPNDEPQRVSLYLSGQVFDLAAAQAERLGFPDATQYLTDLVLKAVEAERVRQQVAGVEARRGPFEGLQAIAEDPEFLAELQAAGGAQVPPSVEVALLSQPAPGNAPGRDRPTNTLVVNSRGSEGDHSPMVPESFSQAALVVLRHACQLDNDPNGFLGCLRRGDSVPPVEVAELAQALHQLELEYRGLPSMGRRLTFALHRLAFESQILHTDAWPDIFDVWTVDTVRSVHEAVERILSGMDIRYLAAEYPTGDSDGWQGLLAPNVPREPSR